MPKNIELLTNIQFYFVCFLFFLNISILAQTPEIRIGWDHRSRKTFGAFEFDSKIKDRLTYPRLIKLKGGDMVVFFQNGQWSWDIYSVRSADNGKTWSKPVIVKKSWYDTKTKDNVCFATPEVIQLKNGDVLFVCQRRNNKKSNETDGLEMMISRDECKTWSAPFWAYRGINWEPSMCQLTSGEVQLYFTYSGRTHVEMVRSFDNGRTWLPKQDAPNYWGEYLSATISYNANKDSVYSDGMAVGTELQDSKGIAYAIESLPEDAVIKPISPTIVWSSSKNNWRYPNFKRWDPVPAERRWPVHKDFRGWAPYLIQLPTGETLLQSNGQFKGKGGMWVFVGNENSKDFGRVSKPYSDISGWWGSIKYIENEQIASVANYEVGDHPTALDAFKNLIFAKGNIVRPIRSIVQSPIIDGIKDNLWTEGNSWFIGSKSQAQGNLKIRHDANNLYLLWQALDSIVCTDSKNKTDDDGFVLYLNTVNTKSTSLTDGILKISANASNLLFVEKYQKGSWQSVSSVSNKIAINISGTANINSDFDYGYTIECQIPWSLIGQKPSSFDLCNAHLNLKNDDNGNSLDISEEMDGNEPSDPSSWLGISFGSITTGLEDHSLEKGCHIYPNPVSENMILQFDSKELDVKLYDVLGNLVFQKHLTTSPFEYNVQNLPRGMYMLHMQSQIEKVIVK